MKVNRIVANIETSDIDKADAFYREVLGLDRIMDHGWIRTYGSDIRMNVQISFALEGGAGTPVPDLSIEVDELRPPWLESRKHRYLLSMVLRVSPGEYEDFISMIRSEN
jgi:catechol 2,3-dioxygenase-like lactoylglutathione lyase family enzyme